MKADDGSLDDTVLPFSETVAETLNGPAVPRDATYKLGELLGRGGMGEVLRAEDLKIGRDIAIKRMRSASPSADAIARFLREAKIQARLDHPAIVPVHELGTDPDGRPFFTMKKLTGTTLAEVLAANTATQQRLLRAFVDVCHAVEFAHARGVIHRDLKPANIMLGNYGEVYVLDWGVARVVGERDVPGHPDSDPAAGETQAGAVLGTPGYMSPEQVRGEAVTPATDLYALGSILFEILAGQAVHPPGREAMTSTLAGVIEPPAKRFPARSIAPELDKLCMAALAQTPTDRPSAKLLAAQVQGFLDGDRDTAARRAFAAELLATAQAALAAGERGDAVHAAGRALSLDPQSEAAALLSQLIVQPPTRLPSELEHELAELDATHVVEQSRLAGKSMISYLVLIPLTLWMGVKDWRLLAASCGLIIFNTLLARLTAVGKRPGSIWIAVVTNALMMVVFGRAFGPFLFVPGVMVAVVASFAMLPSLIHAPVRVISLFVLAFLIPIGLELSGIWGSTFELVADQFVVTSPVLHLEPVSATVFLTIATAALLVVAPLFVRAQAVVLREQRRTVEIQAWHLRQLLPRQS